MKKFLSILLITLTLTLSACSDPSTAKDAVENLGMTNIETHGWSPFGCGEDDTFHTKFTAINPQGKRVSGIVCSSWFKGATVRFY